MSGLENFVIEGTINLEIIAHSYKNESQIKMFIRNSGYIFDQGCPIVASLYTVPT